MPKNYSNYNELTANKKAFVDWLATPEFERDIKTQRQLAEKLGVSEVTLSRWKKDNDIIHNIVQRKKELAGVMGLPKVIDALMARAVATKGKNKKYATKDAELFLKWFFGEDFGGGVNVNVNQTNTNKTNTPATEKLAKKLAEMQQN